MLTETDATLYTRSIIARDESYTRSVITGVHWENRKAVNVITSGLLDADSAVVFIPTYGRTVSIKPGDVLVKGQVSDAISPAFTMTALRAKYPDVITVRSVDRFDYGAATMRHLKVSGQ